MIGAALARTAIEEPVPGKEITPRLIREIHCHCNLICTTKKETCSYYGKPLALKECPAIKAAEPDLRMRAGC